MRTSVVTVAVLSTLALGGCASATQDAASRAKKAEAASARSSTPVASEGATSTSGTELLPREPPLCPNPHGGACLGPLTAGTYETSVFQPGITYTVPAGWTNFEDLPGNFWHFRENDPQEGFLGGSYLGIFQNVRAPAITCEETWQEGVGTTPEELVAWYQSVPGLDVSAPRRVTVGGLDGLEVDLSLAPGADACRYGPYTGIPVLIGGGVSGLHHVVLEPMDLRLIILDWQGGNVTLEVTNVREQHSAEEFRSLVRPIVDSLEFAG